VAKGDLEALVVAISDDKYLILQMYVTEREEEKNGGRGGNIQEREKGNKRKTKGKQKENKRKTKGKQKEKKSNKKKKKKQEEGKNNSVFM
jgi:hypothetical protein